MIHPSIPDLKAAAAIVARLVADKWIQDYINSMDENAQYYGALSDVCVGDFEAFVGVVQ